MPQIEKMGESDLDIVPVTPFVHQVGGHTCVLQVTPNVICKPYQENEVMFYRKLPEELRGFVPFYRGVINIKCDSDNGHVTFQGEVPKGFVSTIQETTGDLTDKISLIKDNKSISEAESLRAWSDECIRRQIDRYGYWREGKVQKFIMLENLVAPYCCPCVMDLKMGTRRQISRDDSETKKRMLEERWMTTTSASLGFRMCGTQVYKNDSKSYISHDKYFGRGLDKNGVRDEMMNFFHDGLSLRKDVITSIITKLRHMLVALDTQRAFKLYSCSLLILYDGDITPARDVQNKPLLDVQTCINDVRLIDFANAIETSNCSNEDITSKAGIRFGIKSLITILEEFL